MQSNPIRQFNILWLVMAVVVLLTLAEWSRAQAPAGDELPIRVVDSDGQPVEGAMIAGRFRLHDPIRLFGFSDEQGAGRVKVDADAEHLKLLVRAEGYGLVDHNPALKRVQDGEAITIQLPPAARISGRLLNEQGQPAAGVNVRPYKIIKYQRRRSLGEAIEEAEWVRELERDGWPVIEVKPSSDALLPWVETDKDGRFTIESVAPDQLAGLLAIGERTAATTILVRTDEGRASRLRTERGAPDITLHPRDGFEQTVARSVPIVGRVSEPDPGGPVIGATVSPWRAPVFGFYQAETLLAVQTDVFGKYRLIGMPVGNWRIFAEAPAGRSMVAVERRVEIKAGDDVVTIDYAMPRGVTVTGQVTDRNTGEPVPGTISFYVFSDNPHLKPLKPSAISIDRHSASVDEEGRFEIAVLPGPGILTFMASTTVSQNYRRGIGWEQIDHHVSNADGNLTRFRTQPSSLTAYNCTQLYEVDIPDIIGTHPMDLVVGEERIDVPLTFTRADGERIPSSVYYSNATPDVSSFRLFAPTSSNEQWREATVSFFEGDSARFVQACDGDKQLAGWTTVSPEDETATIELKEAAIVRGRVVNSDGTPVADAALRTPYPFDPTQKQAVLPSQPDGAGYYPSTDEEGRFELVGLAPDLPLTIMIDQTDEARNRLLARHYLFEKLELKAGEDRDLGEMRIDQLREWTRDD
jgi:protocatechuate 3,4-dioxygenase beta subunit